MYDPKTIRRRRAVLALLVVCSVVLLTASFGGGGGAGSVQRGVFEIVSPVQDVASRSLKPFRDLFGWFGDTWRAKGENQALRKDRDALREQSIRLQADLQKNRVAAGIAQIDSTVGLADLGPVNARVISSTGGLIFQSFNINKGSGDGVRFGQAVITNGGLVGRIESVTGSYSTVKLITDTEFGAQVKVARTSKPGTLSASGGSPTDLKLEMVDPTVPPVEGAFIVTRGTAPASAHPSLFPPDVGVGRVTKIDDAGTDTQIVHVRPFVDVRDVDHVQVLTRNPATIG